MFNALTLVERSSNQESFVIDGGFLSHKVVWNRNLSFNYIAKKYIKYVQEQFGFSASIVFDGYLDDPNVTLPKPWERLRRIKNHNKS